MLAKAKLSRTKKKVNNEEGKRARGTGVGENYKNTSGRKIRREQWTTTIGLK
jgi:hypothetical protein